MLDHHPPSTGTDETDGLSGKDGGDVDGQKSDKIKNDYFKFYFQGRCKFGKRGKDCRKVHPPLCRSFIIKGDDGCDKGENCRYTHHKLCVKSLQDKSCPRKTVIFIMLQAQLDQIGQERPKRFLMTQRKYMQNNTVPKNSQHSPADQNLHLHKQPVQPVQTSEVNTSKHAPSDAVSDPQNSFLEKINQRMANMEQMQNFLLQFIAGLHLDNCIFSLFFYLLMVNKFKIRYLPISHIIKKKSVVRPLEANDQTPVTNVQCPISDSLVNGQTSTTCYNFLLLNIAHLL